MKKTLSFLLSGYFYTGEHCLDEESDRKFSVGDTFYRLIPNDRIRKECQCRMVSGMAEIVCTDATCKLRDPPTQVANTGEMRYGNLLLLFTKRKSYHDDVYINLHNFSPNRSVHQTYSIISNVFD